MNERIQELIKEATISRVITGPEVFTTPPIYFDKEKFAALIVQECAEIALLDGQTTGNFEVFNKIQKHFGVE